MHTVAVERGKIPSFFVIERQEKGCAASEQLLLTI